MCSTTSERLARIDRAIDELAADSLAGRAGPDAGIQGRLARVWAMVAELDPEIARRVPGYHPAQDSGSVSGQGSGTDPISGSGSGEHDRTAGR
jgi:hypothetical protein